MPLTRRSTTASGALSLGAAATVVDVVAVHEANQAHDGKLVTSHLALRIVDGPTTGVMEVRARVLHAGRSSVLTAVDVRDQNGTVLGTATVTSGALGGASGSHRPSSSDADFYVEREVPTGGPTTHEYLQLRPVPPDERDPDDAALLYELDFHEPLRNVAGVLHGGAAALIVEHAGLVAAEDLGVPAPAADELDVHFLAPGLAGPFRCRVVPAPGVGAGGRRVFAVEVHDQGREGRLVAYGLTGVTPLATG